MIVLDDLLLDVLKALERREVNKAMMVCRNWCLVIRNSVGYYLKQESRVPDDVLLSILHYLEINEV